jgi:hypothetical protein
MDPANALSTPSACEWAQDARSRTVKYARKRVRDHGDNQYYVISTNSTTRCDKNLLQSLTGPFSCYVILPHLLEFKRWDVVEAGPVDQDLQVQPERRLEDYVTRFLVHGNACNLMP